MAGGFEQTKENLQRTVREVIRVIVYRRWAFFAPFCLASSAIFVSSHNLPRVYRAHTLFERRNPIPIAKVLDRTGPESIATLRRNMPHDLTGKEALSAVVGKMGMTDEMPRDAMGNLSDVGQAQLASLVSKFEGMLTYRLLETSPDIDRVQISATGDDPALVVKLANAVRDHYYGYSKDRYLGMLREARAFYGHETELALDEIDEYERQMREMEERFPYVAPGKRGLAGEQVVYKRVERTNLKRRIENHRRRIVMLETRLVSMPIPRLLRPEQYVLDLQYLDSEAAVQAERQRLLSTVLGIRNQIEGLRVERQMLDAHPQMRMLMRKAQKAKWEFEKLEGKDGRYKGVVQNFTSDPAEAEIQKASRQQVQYELADLRASLATAEANLKDAEALLAQHEKDRALSLANRRPYLEIQQKHRTAETELAGHRGNERRIARVLEIDAKDQGIEFITLEEAETTRRPVLPKSNSIMLLAFGVGLAAGACAVFLREFFDNTLHTASSVTFSLGLQVLDGIDEILLPADRRRLLLKRLATIPIACLFFGALVTNASLAWLSLENPPRYRWVVNKATSVWNHINFLG